MSSSTWFVTRYVPLFICEPIRSIRRDFPLRFLIVRIVLYAFAPVGHVIARVDQRVMSKKLVRFANLLFIILL